MLFPESQAATQQLAIELDVSDPTFDLTEARTRARELALARTGEHVSQVLELDADGVGCRTYLPALGREGVVIYVHGGGFVLGDLEVYDHIGWRLANRVRRRVPAVDYRLAPEHPYPSALEDFDTVLGWLEREGQSSGLTGKLKAVGDGAGGTSSWAGRCATSDVSAHWPCSIPCSSQRRGSTRGTRRGRHQPGRSNGSGSSTATPTTAGSRTCCSHRCTRPSSGRSANLDRDRRARPPAWRERAPRSPTGAPGVRVVASRFLGQINDFARRAAIFPSAASALGQVADFVDTHL